MLKNIKQIQLTSNSATDYQKKVRNGVGRSFSTGKRLINTVSTIFQIITLSEYLLFIVFKIITVAL